MAARQSQEIHNSIRGRVQGLERLGLDHEKRIGRVEGKLVVLLVVTGGSFAGIVALILKLFAA
jgi:hypothetical protein|tara:strand:+ start:20894 stop:21082 length:189 start_codon:yes stop_codon:yes gene_type:complete